MDLRQVEYVVAIVDHGGFTRAANALGLAQPSLSQSVRRLEEELGAPLLARMGRRVELTEAGESFLGPARRLLREAQRARDAVAAHAGLTAGTLDLVALASLAVDPVAGLVADFRRRHPGVTVRMLDPSSPAHLLELVRSGRAEAGITEADGAPPGLVTVTLSSQSLVAVLPPARPGADGPTGAMSARELAGQALVVTPPGTSLRTLVDRFVGAVGAGGVPRQPGQPGQPAAVSVAISVAVETDQRDMLVPLVLRGAGAAVLPPALAADAAAEGAVVRPLDPPLVRRIVLVHPVDGLSPAAAAFVSESSPRDGGPGSTVTAPG
ncbi:MAG: LysR family transcriptional regulator [Acidimicrobiales bacterium]